MNFLKHILHEILKDDSMEDVEQFKDPQKEKVVISEREITDEFGIAFEKEFRQVGE